MSLTYRKARRSEAKPLFGLFSESGCGKTMSALLLARGFVGPRGKIVMIETESGRGEVYVNDIPGGYDVIPLRTIDEDGTEIPDAFSPRRYGEAISLAESNGVDALIIDSASHEWEGIGGVLHMAAQNVEAQKKGPLVWQQPKIDHQRHFVGRLLQTPISLVIVCMRAKYPMEQVTAGTVERWKQAGGTGSPPKLGDWARSPTLDPKQSEDILFEMLAHGWIDREHRLQVTRYTRPDMASAVPNGQPITLETGAALARWAAGESAPAPAARPKEPPTLSAVLLAVDASKNDADLERVRAMAQYLSAAEKPKAIEAWKVRKATLSKSSTGETGANAG